MNKLTALITDELLNTLGIYVEHSRHEISYEGYISKSMSCFERIIEYYKLQRDTEDIPSILKLSTPSILRVYSDNLITYKVEVNGMITAIMAAQDIDYIFKKELRTHKLDSLLLNG